ncbi:hypothetical protein BDN67DRAFT_641322 [Paxillus ammoniavirescens]|nr:hypothetical protein BDN67DRAFT_641322 [Paxillus ammoniavirescens]
MIQRNLTYSMARFGLLTFKHATVPLNTVMGCAFHLSYWCGLASSSSKRAVNGVLGPQSKASCIRQCDWLVTS